MIGCHHLLNGHEFEQTLGDGEEQGSWACCSPWGCKESDMTEPLNYTELVITYWMLSRMEHLLKMVAFCLTYYMPC